MERRLSQLIVRVATIALTIVVVLLVVSTVLLIPKAPYVLITGGSLTSVRDLVRGESAGTVQAHLVTVEARSVRWGELPWRRLLQEEKLVHLAADASVRDDLAHGVEARDRSFAVAQLLAGQYAQYPVRFTSDGMLVFEVRPGSLADRAGIEVGDVVEGIGGRDIERFTDAEAASARLLRRSGGELEFQVEGVGKVEKVSADDVTLAKRTSATFALGISGVEAMPRVSGLPVSVIDDANFEGGSGGLALALGLVQALAPGTSGGGRPFAASALVLSDGAVAPVTDIELKARSVREAGISTFLVAAGSGKQARAAAPGLEVVEVATFDDAARWLQQGRGGADREGS